jgi:hypothetical protein
MIEMISTSRIRELRATELRWTQPRTFSRAYELRTDEAVGTLTFPSMFGSLARGESGDGCWTFKRLGFISTHVTIRPCHSNQNIAIFRNNTWSGGGVLEFPDGRRYLANSNFWQTRYSIHTADELPLITFDRVRGITHLSSDVEIHDAARSLPELPWLIMLGWYLTVMQHSDSVAAV